MQTFAYSTPPSVAEAARTALQEDAKLMAGGQTLLQSMKLGLIAQIGRASCRERVCT